MSLLTAGYWPTTYWPSRYWVPDYWPEYGVAAARIRGWDASHWLINQAWEQPVEVDFTDMDDEITFRGIR